MYGSSAVDVVQTHRYTNDHPYSGNLCDLLIDSVHERLQRHHKPLLIRECGLDSRPQRETFTVTG
jgi:hypothetical protein